MDGKWVEEKEVGEERMREVVVEVMRRGLVVDNFLGMLVGSSGFGLGLGEEEEEDREMGDGSEGGEEYS